MEVLKESAHKATLSQFLYTEFVTLSHDINGNHVIQKVLNTWGNTDTQFIYQAMMQNCN